MRLVNKCLNECVALCIAEYACVQTSRYCVLRGRLNENYEGELLRDVRRRLDVKPGSIFFASSVFPGSGSFLLVMAVKASTKDAVAQISRLQWVISLERVVGVQVGLPCKKTAEHIIASYVPKQIPELFHMSSSASLKRFRVTARRFGERTTDITSVKCAQILGRSIAQAHGGGADMISLQAYEVEILAKIFQNVLILSVPLQRTKSQNGAYHGCGVALAMLSHLEDDPAFSPSRILDAFSPQSLESSEIVPSLICEAKAKFPHAVEFGECNVLENNVGISANEKYDAILCRPNEIPKLKKRKSLDSWYVSWLTKIANGLGLPGGLCVVLVRDGQTINRVFGKLLGHLFEVVKVKTIGIYGENGWARIVVARIKLPLFCVPELCDGAQVDFSTARVELPEPPAVSMFRVEVLRSRVLGAMRSACEVSGLKFVNVEELLTKVIFSVRAHNLPQYDAVLPSIIAGKEDGDREVGGSAVVSKVFFNYITGNVPSETKAMENLPSTLATICGQAAALVYHHGSTLQGSAEPPKNVVEVKKRLWPGQTNAHYAALLYNGREVCRLDMSRYKRLVVAHNRYDPSSPGQCIDRIFTMAMRYQSLMLSTKCLGMHAALPNNVFKLLVDALGCSVECFASPLNHTLEHFCTLFPDSDRFFSGKKGGTSFFEFWPDSGSFQCNPVFSVDLATKMFQHIGAILARSDNRASEASINRAAPLSFAIFLPESLFEKSFCRPGKFTEVLNASVRRKVLVPMHTHSYLRGEQHLIYDGNLRTNARNADFNTVVLFLQNEQGALVWETTDNFEAELIGTWCTHE